MTSSADSFIVITSLYSCINFILLGRRPVTSIDIYLTILTFNLAVSFSDKMADHNNPKRIQNNISTDDT